MTHIFKGTDDFVKCFHCGGCLRNWNKCDNPWTEHAKWFPNCKFLIEMKGYLYIKSVKEKYEVRVVSKGIFPK